MFNITTRFFCFFLAAIGFCALNVAPASAQPTLTFTNLSIDENQHLTFEISMDPVSSQFSGCTFNLRVAPTKASLKSADKRAVAKVSTSVNSNQFLEGVYSGYTNSLEQGPTKNTLYYKGVLTCPVSSSSAAFVAQTAATALDHSALESLPAVAFKKFAKHLRGKWEEF